MQTTESAEATKGRYAEQNAKYQTIKISKPTYRRLKMLAAFKGEQLMDLVERLIADEEARVGVRAPDNDLRSA